MKRIYLLALAGLLATAAHAQTRVGIFGGFSMSNQIDHYEGFSYSNQLKAGGNAGAFLDIPLSCRLRLEPGLMYARKGGKQESSEDFILNSRGVIHADYKDKLSLSYVEMPLLLVYRFRMHRMGGFIAGVGAYGAICLEAHTTHSYKYSSAIDESGRTARKFSNELNIGEDTSDQVHRFDAGATGMLGYQWRSGWFLRGSVDLGLCNIIAGNNINGVRETEPNTPTSDPILKNISYMLSIGYVFK